MLLVPEVNILFIFRSIFLHMRLINQCFIDVDSEGHGTGRGLWDV